MIDKQKKTAFTLIELLVVIAIIGLLAGAAFTALGGARDKAHFASAITGIKQLEQAMQIALIDEGKTTWWTEAEIGISNPTISDIIAIESGPMATFSNYLPNGVQNIFIDSEYQYDNDSNVNDSCASGPAHFGVNLIISRTDLEMVQGFNDYFDGEEEGLDKEDCGKVKWVVQGDGTANMFYAIAIDSES